jgi:hypothetical protein
MNESIDEVSTSDSLETINSVCKCDNMEEHRILAEIHAKVTPDTIRDIVSGLTIKTDQGTGIFPGIVYWIIFEDVAALRRRVYGESRDSQSKDSQSKDTQSRDTQSKDQPRVNSVGAMDLPVKIMCNSITSPSIIDDFPWPWVRTEIRKMNPLSHATIIICASKSTQKSGDDNKTNAEKDNTEEDVTAETDKRISFAPAFSGVFDLT